MENQPTTNQPLNIPEAKATVFVTATPIIIEECIEIIEAQHTESLEEKALVVAKEPIKKSPFAIKPLLQSLFYAVQWPQLKRQFTKEALLVNTKRHWVKAAVLGIFFYGTQVTFNIPSTTHSTATILPIVTRSASISTSTNPMPTVSSEAQALVPVVTVSVAAKEQYITRFIDVAQGEMKKFGVPASVILGLSIIESNYGTTPLAQSGHNYFALTCANNPLAEGIVERAVYEQTCYVHYENAWTSFRANSLRLNQTAFDGLKAGKDYHAWAMALEAEGMVESASLIGLIERHNLSQYDQIKNKK
ncbi:MAG: glucosaminidase domain-containing protein [Aureispira sp.]